MNDNNAQTGENTHAAQTDYADPAKCECQTETSNVKTGICTSSPDLADDRQKATKASLPQKQAFCGFLNVLKPPGISSAQMVGKVRRLLGGEKVGHAGTLDPEAAGILPMMVGKAARLFDYLQDKEKAYIAEIAFGCATDTQDAQGRPIDFGDAYPDKQALCAALTRFSGPQMQTPPMYSALKMDGRRLYDMARKGETVTLSGRPVTVYALALLGETPRHGALISVHCSKGFYVRTLCYDLGTALNCPAHMRFLLRTQSGIFTLETAYTLEELTLAASEGKLNERMIPLDTVLEHLPALTVPERLRKAFLNGVPLKTDGFPNCELQEGQPVRLYLDGRLMSIGVRSGSVIRPKTWLGDQQTGVPIP